MHKRNSGAAAQVLLLQERVSLLHSRLKYVAPISAVNTEIRRIAGVVF